MNGKEIWVFLEIEPEEGEIDTVSLGLMTDARAIAEKVDGTVTALLFGHRDRDYSELLAVYGANRAYYYEDPVFEYFSPEAVTCVISERVRQEAPWLLLLADTAPCRELAARLAPLLDTAVVTNCVKTDFSDPLLPGFYRPVFGGQLYQEIVFESERSIILTRAPGVLNPEPAAQVTSVEISRIKPALDPQSLEMQHVAWVPADYQNLDISDAKTIVGAGMGAATDELMPLVEELTALLEGTLGTTRPVVDGGKVPRERLIGQTGKIVSPDFYLALGISGATHHIAGVQDAGKIAVINRDRQAPFFQNADTGILADLRDLLPVLINKIKQARENGEII